MCREDGLGGLSQIRSEAHAEPLYEEVVVVGLARVEIFCDGLNPVLGIALCGFEVEPFGNQRLLG